MAFENTHLFAADAVRKLLGDSPPAELIGVNIDFYYLGAIFPDLPLFSRHKKIRDISHVMHGSTGIPTNHIPLNLIERIKPTGDPKNLAFISGYLTHCAMDAALHPMVYYFSGFILNNTPAQQARSSYLHWHYETDIDKRFNQGFYLDRLVKSDPIDELRICPLLKVSPDDLKHALNRQIFYFRLVRSRHFYWIFKLLSSVGIVSKNKVAGFYENLNIDKNRLPEKLNFQDPVSGEPCTTTLEDLMHQGIETGKDMVQAAYAYYSGDIDRKTCEKTIDGKNLETGLMDNTKADIQFARTL